MEPYTLLMMPSEQHTRLMLLQGSREQLRAVLPPLKHVRQPRAVGTLLEALALWADSRVRVVLCASATASTYWLGLTDARGGGARSVFYEVQVVAPQDKRRAAQVHAFGDFEELRQLSMALEAGGVP
jgi:hypothetical protein